MMEQMIIDRAKFLIYGTGMDGTSAVQQAIAEFGKPQELNEIYTMFDITYNDYVEHIKRKILRGGSEI